MMTKTRILVVEDEAIIAMEIESNLQSIGYEVTAVVNTGDDAITKAEIDKPDLILMDIRIQGDKDGIETAEIIKNKYGIPVVFSTAYLDEERIERAKITMPFGYVLKPIQERDLRVTLEMALYVAKVDEERRKAEQKSIENEKQLQNLFDSMLDAFALHEMMFDGDGKPVNYRFLKVNDAFENLTGLKSEDIIGRTVLEVLPKTEKYWIEKYGDVALTGELIRFENYSQELNKHYEVNAYRPQKNQFACVFKDITLQKQQTEKLKLSDDIINNIQTGFHIYQLEDIEDDRTLRMISANHASEEIIGIRNEDIIGQTLDDSFPGLRDKGIPQQYAEVIRSGQSQTQLEVNYGDDNVNQAWFRFNIFPLPNQCVGIAFEDITNQKQAEESLEKIEWLLEKSVKQNEELTYRPYYGDVTELNTYQLIKSPIDFDVLHSIASDTIDLLETSVAIYEKNGDYAFGMFSSGWCQLMDSASRKLCNTDDNREALTCGKWLCHENCWNESAKTCIESGKSTDIECIGGIHLYAEPIIAHQEVIGVINIGYGNPPTGEEQLKELSDQFKVSVDELKNAAEAYDSRPHYIIELAKKRLKTSAMLIGKMVEADVLRRKTES